MWRLKQNDVYDSKKLLGRIGFHPDKQAALKKFSEWGFIDIFRLHQQGTEQYTLCTPGSGNKFITKEVVNL